MSDYRCPLPQVALTDRRKFRLYKKQYLFKIFALCLRYFNNLTIYTLYQYGYSPFGFFPCYFEQSKAFIPMLCYTFCILDFSARDVENCVEKLNNRRENRLFFKSFVVWIRYAAFLEIYLTLFTLYKTSKKVEREADIPAKNSTKILQFGEFLCLK